MMQQQPRSGNGPTPEQLAAYADGELEPTTHDWVEAWLVEHPEAAGEVEAIQRLTQLWQRTSPPEPTETAWNDLFARVGDRVTRPVEAVAGKRRRWSRSAWGLGLAAVIVVALGLPWYWRGLQMPDESNDQTGSASPQTAAAVVPFPVASTGDVEIVSIEDADLSGLVVGDPPVRGPLNLASASDVTLESVDPAPDGMVPWVQTEPPHPMIVAPLDAGPNTQEEKP